MTFQVIGKVITAPLMISYMVSEQKPFNALQALATCLLDELGHCGHQNVVLQEYSHFELQITFKGLSHNQTIDNLSSA